MQYFQPMNTGLSISNLDKTPFDQLADVLVDEGFQLIRAGLAQVALVLAM